MIHANLSISDHAASVLAWGRHREDAIKQWPDRQTGAETANGRFIGLDVGTETIKAVELVRSAAGVQWTRRALVEHPKDPGPALRDLLATWDWPAAAGAAVGGRFRRQVNLPAVPTKQAQARGAQFLLGTGPCTVVSIGSHGFSVFERRAGGTETFRANARCSQGTGNFLRQLVERFGLSVAEAGALCAGVADPAPLSGRCPVILKTDMTHLANKGEDRARILAGLFDAVCENVATLLRPGVTPARVLLTGGVSRSPRIQRSFEQLAARAGLRVEQRSGDDALYLDALGCALAAAERPAPVPALSALHVDPPKPRVERLPPLRETLDRVRRMPPLPPPRLNGHPVPLTLGFDIGSTGSKAVAMELATGQALWEGYRRTGGAPVAAAQALLREFQAGPAGLYPLLSFGVTGSGREIVGSLLATCYGTAAVYVLNEIAAHAAGALHYDPAVDTIFEIGGQDAKYIRLAGGRVVDCAMNEACSAGTGSFIEEQGRRFAAFQDVVVLNREALAAPYGVALGQHCSVFMAEVIAEAAAAGVPQGAIIAGLYDAVIRNYLHRVKGNRSVGRVIFCQGMPFAADALAAAVARQTGGRVIVPPNPGTVGALGIALLTRAAVPAAGRPALDPARFLAAAIEQKETFVCGSTRGCGGAGNRCRVERLRTIVAGQRLCHTWGGGCALYDRGARVRKLPDRAPDPFRERQALVDAVLAACPPRGGRPRVALTDEFALSSLFPFFARYLYALGLDLAPVRGGDQADLKRGIQTAGVPLCAPLQLYHGLLHRLAVEPADFLFLPRIMDMPRVDGERDAITCPMVQASPDLAAAALSPADRARVIAPVIRLGPGRLDAPVFRRSCRAVAAGVGAPRGRWRPAWAQARAAQLQFEADCAALGRRALAFCAAHDVTPVVVLGRAYTLYNGVLNSNVPPILREQGALALPVDCYPVAGETPVFQDMYWGYGQRILRAAHQIRRTPGVYSLYCSNYSCGPDSFILHFYSYLMEGRPFAIIETDGHAGDAGTKTRVEAFLHCVAQDRQAAAVAPCRQLDAVASEAVTLADLRVPAVRLLVPSMGPAAQAIAACFRGAGVRAEVLPPPGQPTLQLGRRHTSGKECVPTCLTLGSLLERLQQEPDPAARFVFLMPKSDGPCRLGVYHVLHRIVVEQLGWRDRVRIWSPSSVDYFAGLPAGFPALLTAGVAGMDLLAQALHDVRPLEARPGRAAAIHARYAGELLALLEQQARRNPAATAAVAAVGGGGIFGLRRLLQRAGAEFAAARGTTPCPTVLLTGEIYVRCEPFANDFTAEKLEQRGLRVRLTPASEWLDYIRHLTDLQGRAGALRLASLIQRRLQHRLYDALAGPLGWAPWLRAEETVRAADRYVHRAVEGEAVLTVGGAVAEWRRGHIDGVVSVGPLECMPNKIAEAQFLRAAEEEGLVATVLSLNGEPLEADALDNFVFEVRAHFERRRPPPPAAPAAAPDAGPAATLDDGDLMPEPAV